MSRLATASLLASLVSLAVSSIACGGGATNADPKSPTAAKAATGSPGAAGCPAALPAHDDDLTHAPGDLAGKEVARVCVLGITDENRAQVTRVIGLRPGDAFDAGRVRRDLSALAKEPVVEDVAVYVEPDGPKLLVLYALRERPMVADLVFEGARIFGDEALAKKFPVGRGSPASRFELLRLAQALRDEYERQGYRGVKVEPVLEPLGPGVVRVRMTVTEGTKWKLGAVTFQGASKLSETELSKVSELEPGKLYDPVAVERAEQLLQERYQELGYLTSKVHATHGQAGSDGLVPIAFTVEEGDLYNVGKLRIENVNAADKKALFATIKTREKLTFSRPQMNADINAIRDFFAARKQRALVSYRTDVDAAKKTVDVTLEVVVK